MNLILVLVGILFFDGVCKTYGSISNDASGE